MRTVRVGGGCSVALPWFKEGISILGCPLFLCILHRNVLCIMSTKSFVQFHNKLIRDFAQWKMKKEIFMGDAMSIYQFLCLIGFPTLFVTSIGIIHKRIADSRKEMLAVKLGIQAILRAQMIAEYNEWNEKGHAPIWAKDNFENVWKNYHALGANGVMDGIHEEFMNLPTTPPMNGGTN